MSMVMAPLVGAIAAGNCAVMKPSEITAHTSALLARLLPRYLDTDAFAVVEGGVPETTELLEQQFDHILYTGNERVASIVMAAAAKHLTPVTLELGGKSPCLIDKSADIEVAASRIAWGKFINAGQTCVAPDHVLVHREVARSSSTTLSRKIREFYGDDPAQSPDYCRIASERHAARFQQLLEGQKIHTGGQVDVAKRYVAPDHRARSVARLGADAGGDLRARAAGDHRGRDAPRDQASSPTGRSRSRCTCSRRARRSRTRCSTA